MREKNTENENTKIMRSVSESDIKKSRQSASLQKSTQRGNITKDTARKESGFRPVCESSPQRQKPTKEGNIYSNPPIKEKKATRPSPVTNRHTPSSFTGILLAIILVLSVAFFVNILLATTKITQVEVRTVDQGYNDDIEKLCEDIIGKSYLFLDSKELEKSISKLSPLICGAEFENKFPRRLQISIFYETPKYYTTSDAFIYTLSEDLKVLWKSDFNSSDDTLLRENGLIELRLPDFDDKGISETLEFSDGKNYVVRISALLADYDELGKISSIDLRNTQNLYFIFEGRFRCDLGNSDDIEVKLIAAKNIFDGKLREINLGSNRNAIINVSNPSASTLRTDVDPELIK